MSESGRGRDGGRCCVGVTVTGGGSRWSACDTRSISQRARKRIRESAHPVHRSDRSDAQRAINQRQLRAVLREANRRTQRFDIWRHSHVKREHEHRHRAQQSSGGREYAESGHHCANTGGKLAGQPRQVLMSFLSFLQHHQHSKRKRRTLITQANTTG